MRPLFLGLICAAVAANAAWATDRAALTGAIEKMAQDYMSTQSESEHSSGISISVSLPGDSQNINVVAGTVSREAGAEPITPETLFQIGSITKSFTAALLLQLQTEGKLSLDQSVGDWLPEYPAWKDVSLRRLLNMTSGIPGYDNSDAMMESVASVGLARHFSPAVLVGYADPTYPGAPKPTVGYDYSNTNFILAGMIAEKVTGQSVAEEFRSRFFVPAYGLDDMYYVAGVYPAEVTGRMAAGYFWQPEVAILKSHLGEDTRAQDMSWAGAAGAIVSSPEQVTRWVRALFQSDLLTSAAKAELQDTVSMKTGKTIGQPTTDDQTGFGLGVMGYNVAPLGHGWQYEGGSMGFRVIYNYNIADDVVVAIALNSAVNAADDRIGHLVAAIIEEVRKK